MKKKSLLRINLFAALILIIVASGCEKPKDGDDGVNGINGTNGVDGLNGQDANAFCKTCHNEANWTAVQNQLAASKHGYAANLANEGQQRDCAPCHSAQGYLETMATGLDTPAVNHLVGTTWTDSYIGNYSLTCNVCHSFHGTLDQADFPNYAPNAVPPFKSKFNKNIVLDLGTSNVCIRCHQNRPNTSVTFGGVTVNLDTMYNNYLYSSDSVKIVSSRYGGHHGPQAQLKAGVGMGDYEIPGVAYVNSTGHANLSCGDCHVLSTANNTDSTGGHYYKLKNLRTGNENISKCLSCHPTATSQDMNGVQTTVRGLLQAIEAKGILNHWLIATPGYTNDYGGHSNGMIIGKNGTGNATAANPRTVTAKQAAAIFIFCVCRDDMSYGVHNSKYIQALLTNALAAL